MITMADTTTNITTDTTTNKIQITKHKVPAGVESNLLSTRQMKMPTTGGYSKETKIFSPSSRGI